MPPPSSKSKGGSNEFFTDDAYSAGHYSEKEYNEYKKDQVFNPSTPRVLAFLVFAFGIVGAVHGLLELIDANVVHGVRYISHCILAYIVLHFCWIWILCRITLWRTSKRGIQVVERWSSPHGPPVDATQRLPSFHLLFSAQSSETEPSGCVPHEHGATARHFRPLNPPACCYNSREISHSGDPTARVHPYIGIHAQWPAPCAACAWRGMRDADTRSWMRVFL